MLSPKEAAFVREYLTDIDHNGARAAAKAGYSPKDARSRASKMLRKPEIRDLIQRAEKDAQERCGVTKARIVDELRKIAFSDMRRFVRWNSGCVLIESSDALDDDSAACVAEISQRETKFGTAIRFKLHDKVEALDKLARHLGMFTEKLDVDVSITNYTPEQREARIEELLKRAARTK